MGYGKSTILVPTFDNIPRVSKNWKQLEDSPSRDWVNESWPVYVVNLIGSDYPAGVVVEKGALYFLYILCLFFTYAVV